MHPSVDHNGRPSTGSLVHALGVAPGQVVALVGAGGKTSLMYALAREAAALWGWEHVLVTTTTHIFLPTRDDLRSAEQAPELKLVPTLADAFEAISARDSTAPSPLVLARDILPELPELPGPPGPPEYAPGERPRVKGLPPEWIDALASPSLLILVEADGASRRPLKAPADHEPVIPSTASLVVAVAGVDALGRPLDDLHVHRPERFSALTGLSFGDTVTAGSVAEVMCHPEGLARGKPAGARVVPVLNKVESPADLDAAHQIARELLERGMEPVILTCARRWPPLVQTLTATWLAVTVSPTTAAAVPGAGVTAAPGEHTPLKLRYKIWLEHPELGKAFGDGPLNMLERVQRLGSLRRAAAEMRMSYNQAWRLICRLEEALGFSLLERQAGGTGGGGSQVTASAAMLMERYRRFRDEAGRHIEELYCRFFGSKE